MEENERKFEEGEDDGDVEVEGDEGGVMVVKVKMVVKREAS